MTELSPQKRAGETLRKLIHDYYSSQEEFADDYGAEVRTVSRDYYYVAQCHILAQLAQAARNLCYCVDSLKKDFLVYLKQ